MGRYNDSNENKDEDKVIKTNKKHKKRRKNKKLKSMKIIGIVLAILLVIGGSLGGYLYYNVLGKFNSEGVPEAKEPEKKGIANILVVGKDKLDKFGLQRTDTIMLVNFNMENKQINIVSIPRDTEVENSDGEDVLINSLYQGEGIEYLIEKVEEMLGITVNYNVQVDSLAFHDFINAIGGVTVTPKYNMKYSDPEQGLYIDFDKGKEVHLDGEDAERYFRWRKNDIEYLDNDSDGSDLGRIKHQQEFLGTVFEKCKSAESIANASDIIKAIQKNVATNINSKKMLEMALELKDLDRSNINMATIETDNNDIVNWDGTIIYKPLTFNVEKNIELLCKLNPDLSIVDLKKKSTRVGVFNATETVGLATRLQEKLINNGYENVYVSDGDEYLDSGVVQALNSDIAEDLSIKSGISATEELSPNYQNNFDAVIIIGKNYKEKE